MITGSRALLTASLSAAVLLAGCAAQKAAPRPANPNEITIAAAGPMTGDLAVFGEQLRRGAQAAVDDINAKGGVLGKQLHLVLGDDRCDPGKAVSVAHSLVDHGAVFVDGHFCSGSSIPASAVYADAGVLQITPSSTNPALTDDAAAKGISTVMRVANRDDQAGVFAGDWIAKHRAKKNVAVLDDGSLYGRGLADMAFQNMTKGGLIPVLRADYRHGDQDFVQLIDTLIIGKIDVVYVGGYHDDEARILRQARDKGLKAEWISGDTLNTSEFPRLAGPAGEGVRFSDTISAIDQPSAREAVAALRKSGYEPQGYTLNAYAAVQAFAAAAQATGSTDGKAMAGWLRKSTVPTVLGDLSWDAKGDITRQRFAWYTWRNGQYLDAPE
jgi:branched-chain amino acid transport system substrate-binding protein